MLWDGQRLFETRGRPLPRACGVRVQGCTCMHSCVLRVEVREVRLRASEPQAPRSKEPGYATRCASATASGFRGLCPEDCSEIARSE